MKSKAIWYCTATDQIYLVQVFTSIVHQVRNIYYVQGNGENMFMSKDQLSYNFIYLGES